MDLLLFLEVDPVVCHDRMAHLRKREQEAGVSLDYLMQVDAMYFEFLVDWLSGRNLLGMNLGPDSARSNIPLAI